ncbi:MAG: hypothetical protein ACOC8H_02105 [bacterium]
MKRNKSLACLIGVVVFGVLAAAIAYASNGDGESGCRGHRGLAQMKDANFEVKNIANGVVITVTSEKPEVGKAIQARFANVAKAHEAGERHKGEGKPRECRGHGEKGKHHECADECKGHKGESEHHKGKDGCRAHKGEAEGNDGEDD